MDAKSVGLLMIANLRFGVVLESNSNENSILWVLARVRPTYEC